MNSNLIVINSYFNKIYIIMKIYELTFWCDRRASGAEVDDCWHLLGGNDFVEFLASYENYFSDNWVNTISAGEGWKVRLA